jgi:hypothetical protein
MMRGNEYAILRFGASTTADLARVKYLSFHRWGVFACMRSRRSRCNQCWQGFGRRSAHRELSVVSGPCFGLRSAKRLLGGASGIASFRRKPGEPGGNRACLASPKDEANVPENAPAKPTRAERW